MLQDILRTNARARFGREHDFGRCADASAYRRAVPVQDYESLRPYVERQRRTRSTELTVANPVLYARTSGTTGEPKYVPVLERSLKDLRTCQRLSAFVQYNAVPEAFQGRLLGMVSPAVEETLEHGVPCGSTSGFLYRSMSSVLRKKYVVPEEVFAVPDYDLKYELVLRLAVVDAGITYLGSANPSTFLKLAGLLRKRRRELLADVEAGGFGRLDELAPEVRRSVRGRLACTPERVAELREVLGRPAPTLADVWPHLTLVSTWTGGSCGIALESLREELPPSARIAELGYLSSELPGSITVDVENGRGVPTLQHHFFEFVEVEKWDRDAPEFLLVDQLETGSEYYVLVTTDGGLVSLLHERHRARDGTLARDPDDRVRTEGARRDQHHGREALRAAARGGRSTRHARRRRVDAVLRRPGRARPFALLAVDRGAPRHARSRGSLRARRGTPVPAQRGVRAEARERSPPSARGPSPASRRGRGLQEAPAGEGPAGEPVQGAAAAVRGGLSFPLPRPRSAKRGVGP